MVGKSLKPQSFRWGGVVFGPILPRSFEHIHQPFQKPGYGPGLICFIYLKKKTSLVVCTVSKVDH